ncbi:MAG: DUF2797 domain-containing protein [Gammaproteobacteria bacterium]
MQGTLRKMTTELADVVQYGLPLGDETLSLNPLIGQKLKLHYLDEIFCQNCGRKTKKSFSQGFCYPCMNKLAACDMCILKPEKCHYDQGTCREPEWADRHCMVNHIVYLANTSALKVGITRASQVPTRWMDQGATEALPIYRVLTRHISGIVEIEIAKWVADKTNWRAMLKGDGEALPLKEKANELSREIAQALQQIRSERGEDSVEPLDENIVKISYPVSEYPRKVSSFNFDKNPEVEGTLMGIKGQYLIFDTGVINIRKFTGYNVRVEH